MTVPGWVALLVVTVTAALAVVVTAVACRLVPEPEPASRPDPDHDPLDERDLDLDPDTALVTKVPYRSLLRWSSWLFAAATAVAVSLAMVVRLDPSLWPTWTVLAVVGTALAVIDLGTTWLPNAVMYPFWVLVAGATVVSAIVVGPPDGGWTVLRAVVGGLGWAALLGVVWALSRGRLGFGDVRLALGLGAAAGCAGWWTIYTCLLAGTVVGAIWGLVHRLRHGRHAGPFPYGTALVLGCAVGLALTPTG